MRQRTVAVLLLVLSVVMAVPLVLGSLYVGSPLVTVVALTPSAALLVGGLLFLRADKHAEGRPTSRTIH